MDIYTFYDLPGSPRPTVFSGQLTPQRARLPNFTTVQEVSDFVDSSIVWRQAEVLDAFFLFSIAIKLTIEVTLTFFVIHKIYKRSWWIFRLVPNPGGRRIVPNVHACWSIAIAIYGYALTAFLIIIHTSTTRNEPVPKLSLWLGLTWMPLPAAGWYSGWGILGRRRLFRLPASLVNLAFLLLPLCPMAVILYPCILANSFMETARADGARWHHQYDHVTHLSRQMLLEAQSIWMNVLHGCYYLSILAACWLLIAITFLISYSVVAIGLILELRRHVWNSQNISHRPVGLPAERRPDNPSTFTGDVILDHPDRGPSNPLTPELGPGDDDKFAVAEPGAIVTQLFSEEEIRQDIGRSFFPPVAPSATIVHIKAKEAQDVLYWFSVQAGSVMLGTLVFVAAIVVFLVKLYPAAERNQVRSVEGTLLATICAISLVFGLTSSVSVAHGTFEALFATLMTARRKEAVGGTASFLP